MLLTTLVTKTDCEAEVDTATISKQFDQLLATDRTSPEFTALWTIVDRYLDTALAAERRVES